jgi:hypothetical protein
MKINTKFYLVLILIFNFSFFLQGNNITSNEYNNNEDNRNVLTSLATSNSLSPIWYRTWGGDQFDGSTGIALDSSGNLYLTGSTYSFGVGMSDIVLVKYNGNGKQQWYRTWGGDSYDFSSKIMLDSSDNIYLAGQTSSFGIGNTDIILTKYDGNGVQQWNRTWGGDYSDFNSGIALDSSGNVYLVGTTDYGSGNRDIFLVKYDHSGVFQWNCTWDENSADEGYGVAVDSSDYVYVTGVTYTAESWDMALVKYNGNGVQQWNQTWDENNDEQGMAIVVDSSDYVYVTGFTYTAESMDMILVKYNGNGIQQWNRTWGGGGSDMGRGIMVDLSYNVYITGYTSSFGAGGNDMVLVKYYGNGTQQWYTTWGGTNNDAASGIALDLSGNIYLAGDTSSFGAGGYDMVLVKYGKETISTTIQSYNFFLILGILSISILFLVKTILKKRYN